MSQLTKQELNEYQSGWKKRAEKRSEDRAERRHRAMSVILDCVQILSQDFNATDIYLFGSLTRRDRTFDVYSDVDLGVAGIPDQKFYKALGQCQRISEDIRIELVDLNNASEPLRKQIINRGIKIQ